VYKCEEKNVESNTVIDKNNTGRLGILRVIGRNTSSEKNNAIMKNPTI
jgi:hypothetical protein